MKEFVALRNANIDVSTHLLFISTFKWLLILKTCCLHVFSGLTGCQPFRHLNKEMTTDLLIIMILRLLKSILQIHIWVGLIEFLRRIIPEGY